MSHFQEVIFAHEVDASGNGMLRISDREYLRVGPFGFLSFVVAGGSFDFKLVDFDSSLASCGVLWRSVRG